MAGLGRSESAPALRNAGAALSHVPKRATQHACRDTNKRQPGSVSALRFPSILGSGSSLLEAWPGYRR